MFRKNRDQGAGKRMYLNNILKKQIKARTQSNKKDQSVGKGIYHDKALRRYKNTKIEEKEHCNNQTHRTIY